MCRRAVMEAANDDFYGRMLIEVGALIFRLAHMKGSLKYFSMC